MKFYTCQVLSFTLKLFQGIGSHILQKENSMKANFYMLPQLMLPECKNMITFKLNRNSLHSSAF